MKGLHFVRARNGCGGGRWYVYAWRGGPLITRRNSVRKPTFTWRELRNIEKAVAALISPEPGTLASLLSQWRWSRAESPDDYGWSAVPAGTKRAWARPLDEIEKVWGGSSIASWNDRSRLGEIREWRDRAAGAREANARLSALRALLQFGVSRGQLACNLAAIVDPYAVPESREPQIWTDAEMARFASTALSQGRLDVLDGMRLAALTGLSRRDLLGLCWPDFEAETDVSRFPTLGRGLNPFGEALDELYVELRRRYRAPGISNLLVDNRGEPWTAPRFTRAFNRIRDAADGDIAQRIRPKKHLNDLRCTFCAKLLNSTGLSDRAIASALGWRPAKVASVRALCLRHTR